MTANKKRVELYRRLPEIYRIKDQELPNLYLHDGISVEAYQLRSYLVPVEDMFSLIHENIESLYHDFFIEHCDAWVIPYIADLLGTSHLSGEEWTLRADVADTIALRRRKGTLGAIELLAFILTKWGVHSVELLENMVWNQHLNHQRPDEGGDPTYSIPGIRPASPRRGGTVSLRDPSLLAQLNTPFDPFAHVADVGVPETGQVRYNLPNLAIYLWRLKAYRVQVMKPDPTTHIRKFTQASGAARVVRVNIDPVPVNDISRPYVKTPPPTDNRPEGRPIRLFNTNRYEIFKSSPENENGLDIAAFAPRVSNADQVPGPIPRERISDYEIAKDYDDSLASPTPQPFEYFAEQSYTAPQEYLSIETYDDTAANLDSLNISDVGLQLHLPNSVFPGDEWLHTSLPRHWKIRGEDLNAWERGIDPPLQDREIAIDPVTGRMCIGVNNDSRADALVSKLLLTFTYGSVGEVGAHPISYPELPKELDHTVPGSQVIYKEVNRWKGTTLQGQLNIALGEARTAVLGDPNKVGSVPIVIEITDSTTHPLDPAALDAVHVIDENGVISVRLNAPLIIRSGDNERPVISLAAPLAFRPAKIIGADAIEQGRLNAMMDALYVRLEGLFIARAMNFAASLPAPQRRSLPLIARAALNRLEILSCTLDPGGFRRHLCEPGIDRAPLLPGIMLGDDHGFGPPNANSAAEDALFGQFPEINIQRSVTGAIFTGEGYKLCISDSIVESVPVTIGTENHSFAIANTADQGAGYAGQLIAENVTILGRTRIYSATGSGAIFRGVLEVFDEQAGCLKYCYFADDSAAGSPKNRLPQNFACVNGKDGRLVFTSEYFGNPGYCQLSLQCDRRILEEGPGSDQMGAFNFLKEAHKWRNLRIRFREFMPVGIRPLLVPVT